jgi:hypothetical protein
MGSEARFWAQRLRWRLRGAWQWPAFAALTALDALVLHVLPPASDGVGVVPALLLAAFANLFLLGALAPLVARRLDRRPGPEVGGTAAPFEVLQDRTATGLLLAGAVGVLLAGALARPGVAAEQAAGEANGALVRDYVADHGEPEYRRNLNRVDTVRLSDGSFRTCVPGDDLGRALCFFVDPGRRPPSVRRDSSPTPNAIWLGAGERF